MHPRAKTLLATLALLSIALAGCSDGGGGGDPDTTDGPVVPPPSEGMGAIAGVVVDDAVRPVEGADVEVVGQDPPLRTTTDAQGTFVFTDVEPGTYFVKATKLGHFDAQQSVEVVADEAKPKPVRLLLSIDAENLPFVETQVFDGFFECSSSVFGLCGFANGVSEDTTGANATNDDTQRRYELLRQPTWIQSEVTWDSTQASGDELYLAYSYGSAEGAGLYSDHAVEGTTPLVLSANETVSKMLYEDEGNGGELYIRTFIGAVVEAPETPVTRPFGPGVAIQQEFRVVTHIFYGYAPPEGWTFGATGEAPGPGDVD